MVSLAVRSQEKSLQRVRPADTKDAVNSRSPAILSIAADIAPGLPGCTESAASPATSGNDPALTIITGVPQAIASRTGNPNPSRGEGETKTDAPLYRAGNIWSGTYPVNSVLSPIP